MLPPPTGTGGIMFLGCPSIRRYVRVSVHASVRSHLYLMNEWR